MNNRRLLALYILICFLCGCSSQDTVLDEKETADQRDAFIAYNYLYDIDKDSFNIVYNKLLHEDTIFFQLMDSCYSAWESHPPKDFIAALNQLDTMLCDITKYDMIISGNLFYTYDHWFKDKWKLDGSSNLEIYCRDKLLIKDQILLFIILHEAMVSSANNVEFDNSNICSHLLEKYNIQDSLPIKLEYEKIEKFVNNKWKFFKMPIPKN